MQVFKVKLDIKGLAQGAKEGEKALNGLSASADKSSNHIEKLNKSIANIQESRRRSARASIPKKPGDLLFIGFQEIIDGYQNNQRRIDKSYLEISTSPDEMHKNMVDGFATLKEKMLLKEYEKLVPIASELEGKKKAPLKELRDSSTGLANKVLMDGISYFTNKLVQSPAEYNKHIAELESFFLANTRGSALEADWYKNYLQNYIEYAQIDSLQTDLNKHLKRLALDKAAQALGFEGAERESSPPEIEAAYPEAPQNITTPALSLELSLLKEDLPSAFNEAHRELQDFNQLYSETFKNIDYATGGIEESFQGFRNAAVAAYGEGSAELAAFDQQYARLKERMLEDVSTDWSAGLRRGLRAVGEEYGNMARNMETLVTSAFSSIGQSWSLTTEGMKFDWKSCMDNILNQAFQMMVVNPLLSGLSSGIGSIVGGLLSSPATSGGSITLNASQIASTIPFPSAFASAAGNAFTAGTGLSAYRNRIVSSPTYFAFASGGVPRLGLMGEKPGSPGEAILPLTRTRGGNLGVEASVGATPNITIINTVSNDTEVEIRQAPNANGGMDVEAIVRRIYRSDVANGGVDRYLQTSFGLRKNPVGR